MFTQLSRASALCALGFLALMGAQKRPATVGASAVWRPGSEFLKQLHEVCEPEDQFMRCAAEQVAETAPAEAAAFSRAIGNDGWMHSFREAGRVDFAQVVFPFRANENYGWLFVNGSPATVDPDDLGKLPRAEFRNSAEWARIVAAHPNATLFPADRFSPSDPVALVHADGSQQFLVAYRIGDGCRACATVGIAFFNFEFNNKGKFTGARLVEVQPWTPEAGAAQLRLPARPLRVRAGQKFTLALDGEGGQWTVAEPPSDAVLRAGPSTEQDGAQMIPFEVVGAGRTAMLLRSGDGRLALDVNAAPGLRK